MKRVNDLRKQATEGKVLRYDQIRSQIKTLTEEKDKLAKEIKEYSTNAGVKDATGSYFCDCDNYVYGNVAKTTRKIDQEKAIKLLKEYGYQKCITTKEVVDEAMLEKYLDKGKLDTDDLDAMTTTNTSYSVSVVKKEEMPVIEQATIQMAASKRPSLRIRR